MNILKLQDDLKNFSQQQLVMEMQKPSGNVPQFLVLSELSRRKRMQTDQARAEAANTPTVAQEAVAAAGMPMGGVTQMAQAMAPKTSMTENTGIAAMMPKQPTRMAEGGVVKMATAGSPTREVMYEGQRYLTDGSGRVFKASRRGSMRRGQEITDPEIVSAVLGTGPSVTSDVDSLGDVSTNLDTFSPVASQGITPVRTPDGIFTDGMFVGQGTKNKGMPTTDLGSADMSSVLSMTRGMPAMRDPAVIDPATGQPYDAVGLMRQQAEQARQANAQAAFDKSLPIPDELMVPFNNAVKPDPQSEIAGIGRTNFKTATALEAENQNREDSFSTFPVRNQFQDNQPQVGDVDPRSIYNLGPGSTAASEPFLQNKNPLFIGGNTKTNMPFMQQFRIQGGLDPIPYSDDLLPPKLDEEKPAPEQIGDATDAQNIEDVELLAPEKTELSPEQKLLQKLEAKSAESTGALMDFYKDLEKDKKYETAMKMVEFGAELMKPTATIGEGVGKATQAMVKGAKDRKKDYNKNKIAILSLQERIDASKAAALRSEIGLGIQQANLDLRRELGESRASAAELKRVQDIYDTLNEGDRYALLSTLKELSPQQAQELAVLQKYRDMLTGGVSSTISANVADA